MKIYFSPEFAGKVFLKPKNGSNVMMDTVIVNTIGLLDMLELRLGLHYQDVDEGERLARCYDAMRKYLKSKPDNVFSKSFELSGLATAKAVLAWRDELRLAQWDFDGEDISERLETIIGIENIFRKNESCDLAGRLHIATDQIAFQQLDCSDIEIIVPCNTEIMKPCVRDLLETMKTYGATVKIRETAVNGNDNLSKIRSAFSENIKGKIDIDPKDESLLIYKFPDEHAAHQYFAYYDIDADVWINADNKQMDSWLLLMGKPLTGSMQNDCLPQLSQLFVTGIGLFSNPLNVNTLIDWLNMPLHPLNRSFRSKLAQTIVSTCGYRNDECKSILNDFVDGKFEFLTDEEKQLPENEQQKIREKDRGKRKELLKVFLPPIEKPADINVSTMTIFVEKLSGWARQKAYLMSQNDENPQWAEQLSKVASMANAFSVLLNATDSESIDYKTVESWINAIFEKSSFTNAIAEQGCRIVVDSPAKLASVADKTIWMNVDGDNSKTLECSFLFPDEMRQLVDKQYYKHWDENCENKYHNIAALTPLYNTQKQLILVVCDRRNGEPTQKHPLIVRLEQQLSDNFKSIIREPKIETDKLTKIEMIDNHSEEAEIHFENAEKLKWPDHLSPTIVDALVNNPFDYMMQYLLDIESDGKAKMGNLKVSKGNVAHAVIEKIFAPRGDEKYTTAEDAANRKSLEFEKVYKEMVEARGAILQLPENVLDEKLLHEQLQKCLDVLVKILKDNNLKVTSCERHIEADLKLGLPTAFDENGNQLNRDMTGNIDMTLEDENGKSMVFDFKWTSSKSYYRKVLEDNRSIQLEFYRYMLTQEKHDDVERVAYFVMPEARLYSLEKFEGENCYKVDPANNDNIVVQLCNSIKYRKQQLDNGVVEMNGEPEEMQYENDCVEKNLFPLQFDEKTNNKIDNKFSEYKLFTNN